MPAAALLDADRFCVDVVSGPQTGSEGSLFEEVQARVEQHFGIDETARRTDEPYISILEEKGY